MEETKNGIWTITGWYPKGYDIRVSTASLPKELSAKLIADPTIKKWAVAINAPITRALKVSWTQPASELSIGKDGEMIGQREPTQDELNRFALKVAVRQAEIRKELRKGLCAHAAPLAAIPGLADRKSAKQGPRNVEELSS